MSAATSPPVLTLDAWAALDEDDSRELVDGRLEDEEVPSAIHETVVRWLLVLLDAYFRPRGGLVYGSGIKLAVRARSGRFPMSSATGQGGSRRHAAWSRSRPTSSSKSSCLRPATSGATASKKPDDYGAFGVRYYWLVDPDYRSFEVWELGADARYVRAATGIAGRVERVPGCDGLSVNLDELWAEGRSRRSANARTPRTPT